MKQKINLMIFVSILFIIIAAIIFIKIKIKHDERLEKEHTHMIEEIIENEYKARLKESVNSTIFFIDTIYENNYSNNFKDLIQKEKFLQEIRDYLYKHIIDKSRYSWINEIKNFEGGEKYAIRLIHPNLKSTEKMYLNTSTEDIKGNKPYLEELEGIKKNGEIYFKYYFKEINSNEITKKLSYAKLYKRFNWIIATGIPLNELQKEINLRKDELIKSHKDDNNELSLIAILILILIIFILIILRRVINNLVDKNFKYFKKYKEALFVTEDGIWEYEPLINKITFNSVLMEMLGYKKGEVEESFETLEKLLHPDDVEKVKKGLNNFVKSKTAKYHSEFRMLCKNGKYKWILSRAKVVEKDEKNQQIIRVVGIHTDIDVKKKLDLKLNEYNKNLEKRVNEELENSRKKDLQLLEQSKMASLGEMIGNIAHQWRQPLSVISTATSGINFENEVGNLDKDKITYYSSNILNSTKYLSETIDTFRNFLKEDKQKTDLVLQERINISLKITNDSLKNNGIELINCIDYTTPIIINMVKGEFSQVVINLISNAKDILLERKIVKPWIKLELLKQKDYLIFSVEDNAGGVPENIISKIFEPYFTTKHGSLGTGLGLYMSYKIVTDSLKGNIYVKNSSNGAKFFVKIPIQLTKN
ncbi:hypothetical protein CRV08_00710 [Halarcobacter ebronensis]|uniref:histidine kinase n=1 Tax=Halarcobacter ebronensis TaxID=1462615 RepID=A0A4Q0YHJ9_9BACT|nr:PAS domain-containing protein [Halarcobacter ebronensis]RXJ70117.1 hypothetical protein CRV08_00710 [Halarcobacter ebronensis]